MPQIIFDLIVDIIQNIYLNLFQKSAQFLIKTNIIS